MDKIFELLNIPVLMEPDRFNGFLRAHQVVQPLATIEKPMRTFLIEGKEMRAQANGTYIVTAGGIAVIPVIGPMFKGYGSWGYADQTEIRAGVRQAANDPSVSGIMLLIDSPGGTVAGTADLAEEIRAADAIKPVMAYIEDCGCSAGYWTAAAARAIYSNGGMVGSIGVVTALVDSSKYFENAGIKVIPIVTGAMKAVGMDGTPVSPEQIAYVQGLIEKTYDDFVAAVSKGRGIRGETVRKMEAKVFIGEQAVENKLIDGVMSFDKAFVILGKAAKQTGGNRRAKALLQLEEMQD